LLFDVAEEKRKQEFFKARGLLKEQKEGISKWCGNDLTCKISVFIFCIMTH